MARKNCENVLLNDEESDVPGVHNVEKISDASKKLFSSLSHADLDKIIRGDGNSNSCKKKISQIGCSSNWSPPKKANVKEPNSNSFDVVKCLIDGLSDHDYAVPQGKMHKSNSREKNVPNTTKPTCEKKSKQETKEKTLNGNENDIVGQIIQNMDKMKPDVISHLITAATQDGSNNVDNTYQSSKKTKKSVFFKASHKYTYKNYKLSNNIVIQKANNSLDQKKVDSLKELHNNKHRHQTTFNTLPPRNTAYKPRKRCCFVCGSRWTPSTKNRFCLKCKRSGEEFPLLKEAQKQMFFLNSRSCSAPKQRAHLSALEKFNKENPQTVGASDQRRCPHVSPKSKYHRLMCDLREKGGSAYDEDRNLNSGDMSDGPTPKASGNITPLNHTKGVRFKSKENKSSNINLNLVKEKVGGSCKKQYQNITNVSSSGVIGKQLVSNKHNSKKLNMRERHSTDGVEIKQKQNSSIPKLKNKPEEIILSDSDNISEDTDNGFASVKSFSSNNVTCVEHELCRESSTTERNVNISTTGKKKSKKIISIDMGDNAPEAAGNIDLGSIKRRQEDNNTESIKKSKKMVLVDSGDNVRKATDDINFIRIKSVKKKNASSGQMVLKESDVAKDDLKIEERCYTLKHKKKYKHLPSNSEVSFCKETDSYYHASLKSSKNKNISYAAKEAEHKSSKGTVIKSSLKKKPLSTAHTWHVLKQSKKRKKVKMLASDSDDSDMQQDKKQKKVKMLSDSFNCKLLTSDSDDFKVLASDSNDHKVLVSDSDDSLNIVSKKKIDKNIVVASQIDNGSPKLSGPINIVTYVVDKDSNVKVMPDLLVHEKQKSYNKEEKPEQCFSETYNSSKELVDCTPSPECCDQLDESPFTDETDDSSSNKDYKHCDIDETISKADEVPFHRSSEILCFNLDSSNESAQLTLENLDNHEAQTETTLTSYVSNQTDENVAEVPTHINLNRTDFNQKQLVLESEPKVDPVEGCVTSTFHKDKKTSEIEIIDLSPCPSPLEELLAEDKQMLNIVEHCVESAFCTDKTSENSLSSYSRYSEELISGNRCKSDISEECMQSDSCSGKSNGNDSSSLECHRKRVILTNIDETVPSYLCDTVYVKSEQIEIEKASDIVPSKSEISFIDTDTEDFQDNFCYRKLSDGLYLMGLPGEMDGKNTSEVDEKNKIQSNPIPERKDTDEFIASTEVKCNSSLTLHQEKEYKFSYRSVCKGITLMYLSDKESEGESEVPVEEHLASKTMEDSSAENLGHNEEVICLSDDSCIELSDDEDEDTQNNNMSLKMHGNDNEVQTVDTSVKVEPLKDVEKFEVNSVVKGNSHENRGGDTSQNESSSVSNDPVLQISSVFSIPDWDGELENQEGLNDSPVKNVHAVKSEITVITESSTLAETSSSSKGHCNESDSCHRINKFHSDRGTDDNAEKTKLQDQDETRKVDVLLKEIQDSVKEGQCFFNAVSELDSVTSASIIDLELRSTNYSSAIGIAKNQVYEELQQLLNKGEQASSEKLQEKINTLRALELLCQKESQELTTDAQKSQNKLSYDGQSNRVNCELETTTDSIKTQPFADEPVILDSSEVDEEQEPEVIILSPETSNTGLTSQIDDDDKESMLSMLLRRPLNSDKSTYASRFSDCDNQNEPPVYGLHMQSTHNVPPCQQEKNGNFIDLPINGTPVLLPECTTNTSMAQTGEAVQPLSVIVLADDASPHPNIMLTDSVGQLPTTLFTDKTVQPPPAYPVQQCNVSSRPLNYKSSTAAVSPVFSSVGSSEGFISQVQGLDESDITFCVMCPNIATAVCKSCTKVAYCGEVCAIKYWNEVHHKVCMKL